MVFRLHHFILITLVRCVFLIALSLCISSPLLSWLTRCCLHNLCPHPRLKLQDNTRIINYKYSIGQLQPSSRIPGFIFHQTERTADNGTNPCFGSEKLCYDSNARDFDLLGYKCDTRHALLSNRCCPV
jgi:hypothetical protein